MTKRKQVSICCGRNLVMILFVTDKKSPNVPSNVQIKTSLNKLGEGGSVPLHLPWTIPE